MNSGLKFSKPLKHEIYIKLSNDDDYATLLIRKPKQDQQRLASLPMYNGIKTQRPLHWIITKPQHSTFTHPFICPGLSAQWQTQGLSKVFPRSEKPLLWGCKSWGRYCCLGGRRFTDRRTVAMSRKNPDDESHAPKGIPPVSADRITFPSEN